MRTTSKAFAALLVALALASAAGAAPFDWNRLADAETIEVLTSDEDGSQRLTTVWIVVLDHSAYLRTAGTTWGDNVERNGTLRIHSLGDKEFRAEKVLSAAEIERVVAAFREKYGTSDLVTETLFRWGERRVFRLVE